LEGERVKVPIQQLTKLRLIGDDYIKATYFAAQPDKLKGLSPVLKKKFVPAVKIVRNYLDDVAIRLQKHKIMADPFPQSLMLQESRGES